MNASAQPAGDCLTLAGRIHAGNVLEIRRRGESWLASLSSGTNARVDLAATSTASSVLLSLLLCLHREAARRQVPLTFTGVPDDLLGLSRLNGVSRWLTAS